MNQYIKTAQTALRCQTNGGIIYMYYKKDYLSCAADVYMAHNNG